MNIGFHSKDGLPAKIENNIFTFSCAKPIIIQSSEIKKVQTNITIELELGFILTIFSASNIYEKSAEVFPGPYIIDNSMSQTILEIPIRNYAGTPLHLMEGSIIARGYISKVSKIKIKEIESPQETRRPMKRSVPIKSNSDIQFEVK